MKCHNCNYNDAEINIRCQYGEREWEVQLCPQCAAAIQHFTGMAMAEYRKRMVSVANRAGGSNQAPPPFAWTGEGPPEPAPIPADAGEELRLRRKKQELQALLQEAVEQEDYESAARLRDQMKDMEKGAIPYEQ